MSNNQNTAQAEANKLQTGLDQPLTTVYAKNPESVVNRLKTLIRKQK